MTWRVLRWRTHLLIALLRYTGQNEVGEPELGCHRSLQELVHDPGK